MRRAVGSRHGTSDTGLAPHHICMYINYIYIYVVRLLYIGLSATPVSKGHAKHSNEIVIQMYKFWGPSEMQLRVVLLLLVAYSIFCTFVLEQPRQSLLARNRRWEWFANRVALAMPLHASCSRLNLIPQQILQAYMLNPRSTRWLFGCSTMAARPPSAPACTAPCQRSSNWIWGY